MQLHPPIEWVGGTAREAQYNNRETSCRIGRGTAESGPETPAVYDGP